MISTESLTKRYGRFEALKSCSFDVQEGEVYGLLGPNGAGKTTLIRLLLGFLKPSSGRATIAGLDCERESVKVRRQLSYLPAEAKLFRRMKGKEALRFFAAVRGKYGNAQRAFELADRLDLDSSRRIAMMSTGMRQKLALAATLSHEAPLLILDEPTANLDPNVRSVVMQLVNDLKAEGRTVLMCSHVLSEIEASCDRVGILRQGELVHTQVIGELRKRHRIRAHNNATDRPLVVPTELAARVQLLDSGTNGSKTSVANQQAVVLETEGDLADLLPWLAQVGLSDVMIEPYGLRSVYDHFHFGDGRLVGDATE